MADPSAAAGEHAISFGPFHLIPAQRLLLEGDRPVRVGSRALDILIALVERPGEVLGKNELMARVWPNTFVEEGNLKFQVSALRRALGGGNRYLVNVPGRVIPSRHRSLAQRRRGRRHRKRPQRRARIICRPC